MMKTKRKRMMMGMVVLVALMTAAQEVSVDSRTRLLEGVQGAAYYPVLNAAGDQLLFAAGENGALRLYDYKDNVVTTVTDDYVAGNDACFGGDNKIYYVTQERGEDNLIYRTGRCYDPITHGSEVVTPAQHGAVHAVAATRGGALKAPASNYASSSDIGTATWTQGSRVFVTVDGEERVFSPVDSWAGYLWASLSPDGRRVAFFAAGKGIVVMDLRGQVLAMLGNHEMPCWYNDDYLVAQQATDDGHQITSSQLLLLKADGTWSAPLTTPASMSMHPTCGGGKIVYTTIDGLLYEMKITIYD